MELSFSEALFRVHHTQKFKLTYPIPLPTSVAGMFGAMLGIRRHELVKEFKDLLFGATVVKPGKMTAENSTYLQYKSMGGKPQRVIVPTTFINQPIYCIAVAGDENQIRGIHSRIENGLVFQPYGGQNDFFCEDWKVKGIFAVGKSKMITNYCPEDWVERIEVNSQSNLVLLPVRHNLSLEIYFYFVINGRLHLRREVPAVEGIALYSLKDFEYQLCDVEKPR